MNTIRILKRPKNKTGTIEIQPDCSLYLTVDGVMVLFQNKNMKKRFIRAKLKE